MVGATLGERRSADFVAGGASLVNLEVQILWQAQHLMIPSIDFPVGTVLCEP